MRAAIYGAGSLGTILGAYINHNKAHVEALKDDGAIAAFGKETGFPTPMNEKVTAIIHRIENGELRPSFDNLKLTTP